SGADRARLEHALPRRRRDGTQGTGCAGARPGRHGIRALHVRPEEAAPQDATYTAQSQISALLRQRHRLAQGAPDDFTVRNMSDVAEAANETNNVMTMLLGSIASVSLLVGGIGIMNIMLVSV